MKILTKLLIVIALFLMIALGGVFYWYLTGLESVDDSTENQLFIVQQGTSASDVMDNLEEVGLINNSTVANIYVRFSGLSDIREGSFYIQSSWDTKEIIAYLNDTNNILANEATITLIEGEWLKHLANSLSAQTNVTAEELMAFWNDPEVVKDFQTTYPFITDEVFDEEIRFYLEGYLFPNTYNFFTETNPMDITTRLLDQTNAMYEKYQSQIDSHALSIHEVFTLASIVQYEARTVEDMKLIAGVLLNRLAIDMPLQVSASVCYAIDLEEGDDWKKCETNPNFESPYNTYKYNGLPPGPIMSFGEDALEALLNPTESDYLYFVADVFGDGKVHYAATYEEHLDNVARFNLNF